MITLALRRLLTLRGAARGALLVRAAGIAVAVAVLLLAVALNGAFEMRAGRIGWRNNDVAHVSPAEAALQVLARDDRHEGATVTRVILVKLKDDAPVPPGLEHLPERGEVFVSPALADRMEDDPKGLAARFANVRVAGRIGRDGLADPGELVAIMGAARGDVPPAGYFLNEVDADFQGRSTTLFMRFALVVGVVALLVPIGLFVATATRIDAQNDERRLAALRLAGASPAQTRVYACVESVIASAGGAAGGLLLFFLMRPLASRLPFEGHRFFACDFTFSPLSLVILGLAPAIAVIATLFGLRGVELSPLGVSRGSTKKRVAPMGAVAMATGLALYGAGLSRGGQVESQGLLLAGGGIALVVVGLGLTGPWLGQLLARLLARTTRSGALLLAWRRIAADPHSSLRTVSGVTFAIFFGALFLSLVDSLERELPAEPASGFRPDVLVLQSVTDGPTLSELPAGSIGARLVVPRMVVGEVPGDTFGNGQSSYGPILIGDCDDLKLSFPVDSCEPGKVLLSSEAPSLEAGDTIEFEVFGPPTSQSDTAPLRFQVPADAAYFQPRFTGTATPLMVIPGDLLPGGVQLHAQPAMVAMDHPGQLERVRSALLAADPTLQALTAGEQADIGNEDIDELRNLVYLGVVASFVLSGATGALSVTGSIMARRLPFTLLRVSGCSPRTLRTTLVAEATLPLTLLAAIGTAAAVAVASMTIRILGTGSAMPASDFLLPLGGGLAVGLLLTVGALPFLGRLTSLQRTRFE